MSRTIPIFHCFDHNYVLPAAVAFRSMLDHAKSPDTTYALYVVGRDLTDEDRAQLQSVVAPFPQATLTFLPAPDFSSLAGAEGLSGNKALTLDVLYKLAVPALLPQYDVVIVTDVDVVYERDIAEAFDGLEPEEDIYVAGGRDLAYAGWRGEGLYPFKRRKMKKYFRLYTKDERRRMVLGGGFLVFNCRKMRADHLQEKFLSWAQENIERLVLLEQDVINQVCYPKIRALPWNHMAIAPAYGEYVRKGRFAKWLNPVWDAMFTNPLQIHYASPRKPWKDPTVPMADRWFAARNAL